MTRILFLLSPLFALCFGFDDVRVINGTNADEGEFPFAVSLRKKGRHICGATILNKDFGLTAAHCVCNDSRFPYNIISRPVNPKEYSVQYGLTRITKDEANVEGVDEIFCHSFVKDKLIYDAAVLKFKNSLPEGGNWKSVRLSKNFDTITEKEGTIIGWGRTHAGTIPEHLQKLDVDIYEDEVCSRKYDKKHHICFGAPHGGACNGDSGTALLSENVQVGIASFITAECGVANRDTPNVYSRVATYYDWIKEIAGDVQ